MHHVILRCLIHCHLVEVGEMQNLITVVLEELDERHVNCHALYRVPDIYDDIM